MIKKIAILLFILLASIHSHSQDNKDFKNVTIYSGNRAMPFDTFSTLVIRQFSGKNTVNGVNASTWMWKHFISPVSTADDPLFLIDSKETLESLAIYDFDRDRYSYRFLLDYYPLLQEMAF